MHVCVSCTHLWIDHTVDQYQCRPYANMTSLAHTKVIALAYNWSSGMKPSCNIYVSVVRVDKSNDQSNAPQSTTPIDQLIDLSIDRSIHTVQTYTYLWGVRVWVDILQTDAVNESIAYISHITHFNRTSECKVVGTSTWFVTQHATRAVSWSNATKQIKSTSSIVVVYTHAHIKDMHTHTSHVTACQFEYNERLWESIRQLTCQHTINQ